MRYLVIAAVLVCCGCNRGFSAAGGRDPIAAKAIRVKPPIYHFNLLAWYDYDGQAETPAPERALFVLNGTEEGRGREGLKRALDDISTAPKDTVLYLAFHRKYQGSSRPPYVMPYEVLEMRPEWDQVIEGGTLRVEWLTGEIF